MFQHLLRRRQLNYPKVLVPTPRLGCCITTLNEIQLTDHHTTREPIGEAVATTSYPWPEWVAFIGRLSEEGYIEPNTPGEGNLGAKHSNKIRTACLNFARDRFHFIRNFSNKDLKALVTPACPTLDRKVVNSGKRLRAHLGIDEGTVCQSCFLRGHCERAYVKPLKDQGAQTVDVMRVLLTYGLDSVTWSVENKPCLNKEVEESARRLMKQMTEFSLQKVDSDSCNSSPGHSSSMSMCENSILQKKDQKSIPIKQGDWICPKCSFINFARNIKCLSCNGLFEERLKNLGEHQDHLPLKKGDWLCHKCHFLNFAKNSRCLQCKEMPPKRVLNPGEWECDSCNFINFRKNMICLKCDHRRHTTVKAADNSTQLLGGYDPYSADYETCHTQQEARHGYSNKQSQFRDAHRWRFCEGERNGSKDLQPLTENYAVSRLPIIMGRSVLSRDERRRKDGSNSDCVKALPDIDKPIMVDKTALDCSVADDDSMSSWFGRRRTID